MCWPGCLVNHHGSFQPLRGLHHPSAKAVNTPGGRPPCPGVPQLKQNYLHPHPVRVQAALIPELSGVENVPLGCLAMGMTPEQAQAALPDIVELAGIGDSIYRPMRTYSSGMGRGYGLPSP